MNLIKKIFEFASQTDFDFRKFSNPDDELSYLFDEWVPYYRMKYAICKSINPASILEVGVRYGYSAITFLTAAPQATYLGIDIDASTFGGKSGAVTWAKKITGEYKAEFLIGDTQQMTTFPGDFYDLIHIDGQQDGDGTIHDLTLALEKGRWILVDGFFWSKENMLSSVYFLEKYKEFIEYSVIIPSYAGDLLIRTRPSAKHLFSGVSAVRDGRYAALQNSYDAKYFLRDCGGFDTFKRNLGQKLEEPRLLTVFCLANPTGNKKILDIGCGRGELANAMALAGAGVTGIDYSDAAIDIATRTFLSGRERSNLNFIRADFMKWDPPGTFDVILATDLIEHIDDTTLHAVMKKISRILKPGGVLIVHTAPNRHYYDMHYSLLRENARNAGCYLPKNPRTYYEDLMHINEQTPEGLTQLLQQHFSHSVVWVAMDNEMTGSLDPDYPLEKLPEARGIFAVASDHPVSRKSLVAMLTQQPLEKNTARARLQVLTSISTVSVNQQFTLSVHLQNGSAERFASLPPYPVCFSYHWLDTAGNVVLYDGIRTPLLPPLGGNDARDYVVTVLAPDLEGEYTLQLTLVQEHLFWFEEVMPEVPARIPVRVTP